MDLVAEGSRAAEDYSCLPQGAAGGIARLATSEAMVKGYG
jgi:hypothetical protein